MDDILKKIKEKILKKEDITHECVEGLSKACKTGNLELLKTILGFKKFDYLNDFLEEAIWEGHTAVVKYLLDCSENKTIINANHERMLRYAILRKHNHITKILIDAGANPFYKHGCILQLGAQMGDCNTMRVLIDSYYRHTYFDISRSMLTEARCIAERMGFVDMAEYIRTSAIRIFETRRIKWM